MSSWSKTLYGKSVSIERAFQPLLHALVRSGYEVTDVREGKRITFRKRTESSLAWDNHRRAHNAKLTFSAKSKGFFTKELFLEVEITFDDWDMSVSASAAQAWQEIADKLQVMLSDPATFLQLAPPPPIAVPVPAPMLPPARAEYAPPYEYQRLPPVPVAARPPPVLPASGESVWVRCSDGQNYAAYVSDADTHRARVVFLDQTRGEVPLSELSPRRVEADAPVKPQPVVHHVIERQLVVTRCTFCAQFTPVDCAACQSCGATKFA